MKIQLVSQLVGALSPVNHKGEMKNNNKNLKNSNSNKQKGTDNTEKEQRLKKREIAEKQEWENQEENIYKCIDVLQ